MKSILTFLLCVASAAVFQGAIAADAAAKKTTTKPVATGKLSMAEKGSFHKVHARKAKTDCEDCHSKEPLADNVLLVSRNKPLAKGSPGPVDPKECYECHRQKSNKLPVYAPH
ncbi:cytochrome c3 family protein [Herbaspirillum sp. ST 5-3]|uniref:cytochrome c3 family protein n=1 Tax=Oxalobacteraceae TaxID=75682 RepID=UPI0010A53860|nr:cytochrome c3 family protein [Herbaspirillum sp. ST 5-3]